MVLELILVGPVVLFWGRVVSFIRWSKGGGFNKNLPGRDNSMFKNHDGLEEDDDMLRSSTS